MWGGGGGELKKFYSLSLHYGQDDGFKVSRAPLGTSLTADGPPW